MQTIMQYKQNQTSDQTTEVEYFTEKTLSNSRISCEDLLGLSWIFLDDDFTYQFKEDN